MSLRLHALTGVHAVGCNPLHERIDLARSAGLDAVMLEGSLEEMYAARFPDGADIVVDATGSSSVIPDAIKVARDLAWNDLPTPGPRYVIQGSHAGAFEIPYQAAFMQEMTFLIPRDCQPVDYRSVLDLLGRRKLVLSDLVSAVRDPEEAAQTYSELQAGDSSLMTAAFRWV